DGPELGSELTYGGSELTRFGSEFAWLASELPELGSKSARVGTSLLRPACSGKAILLRHASSAKRWMNEAGDDPVSRNHGIETDGLRHPEPEHCARQLAERRAPRARARARARGGRAKRLRPAPTPGAGAGAGTGAGRLARATSLQFRDPSPSTRLRTTGYTGQFIWHSELPERSRPRWLRFFC